MKRKSFKKCGITVSGILLLGALMFCMGAPPDARAAEGDIRGGLFLGTTTFSAGGATTTGTTFGGSLGFEISTDLLLNFGLAFSSTDGEETVNNQTFPIGTTSAEFRLGLTRFFNRGPSTILLPFVGGGLSVLNYDIDHTFPGSELGKTSGTGPGLFVQIGSEIRISQRSTLIISLGVQSHVLKSETGETFTSVSGGLNFSVRLST